MANIKLKNKNGVEVVYENVNSVKFKDTNDDDVVFVANDITLFFKGDDNNTDIGFISVKTGETIYSSQFEVSKTGYSFRGWNTEPNKSVPNVLFPYAPTESITLYPVLIAGKSARVNGLGNQDTNTVVFDVDSDFPQTFEEVQDNEGNVFLKIPTMYRRVDSVVDGQIVQKTISTSANDGFEPYPVFKKTNGDVMPYVLIGKYQFTSTTVASSKSGDRVTMTIGQGRALARDLGQGYQLYDWMFRELWIDLCLMKEKDVHFNKEHEAIASYMGMEHFSAGWWVDGVVRDSSVWRVCYDPSKYVDSPTSSSDGYVGLSYGVPARDNQVMKLGYDSNHPFALFPKEVIGNTNYNTYYCDAYYHASGNHPVYSYLGSAGANYGLFYFNTHNAWSLAAGVRLCYRPI